MFVCVDADTKVCLDSLSRWSVVWCMTNKSWVFMANKAETIATIMLTTKAFESMLSGVTRFQYVSYQRAILVSSTGMNSAECSIYHLACSCISSPREVVPVSLCEKSASVSLLDAEWWNMSVSIDLESILSSEGQLASSKLSINRDTWKTHKSAQRYKEGGL